VGPPASRQGPLVGSSAEDFLLLSAGETVAALDDLQPSHVSEYGPPTSSLDVDTTLAMDTGSAANARNYGDLRNR
jgi:hypothetical protein